MPDTLSPKGSKNPFQSHVPGKMSAKTLRSPTGRRVFADNIDEIQRSLEDLAASQLGRDH